MKKLLIIDSNALVYRSFYALPLFLTDKQKEPVNAVYGFLLAFFKSLKEISPDFVVAIFDLPKPTFRHERYQEYKATRPKAPQELYSQIPKIKKILDSFEVPIFEKQGFEADDIIGTLSTKTVKENLELNVVILTGDLDLLQLVDDKIKVYTFKRGLKEEMIYDNLEVEKRYNISPSQLVDFKALRGDPSDNIPGVSGIGEKTAVKLIKEFNTIENLYSCLDNQDEFIEKTNLSVRIFNKLKEEKEKAFLSKELVQIDKNVDLPDFNLQQCLWEGYDKNKAIKSLQEFNFESLIKRLFN